MKKSVIFLLAAAVHCGGFAQTLQVNAPWVRATVTGQKSTGAFMTIKAPTDMQLVGAQSSVAKTVEVHEMVMDGNVMKMREVEGGLPLPKDKAVELKPGSYHIMLIDLIEPMKVGSEVPLTLLLKNKKTGENLAHRLTAPVKPLAQPAQPVNHSMHH